MRPLLGNTIGLGIFALPYVVAQAGIISGTLALIASALLSLVTLLAYTELVASAPKHAHFVGALRSTLGPGLGTIGAIAFFGSTFGALAAYIAVGGTFAQMLFSDLWPVSVGVYRLLFFLVAAVLIFGGTRTVARAHVYAIALSSILLIGLLILLVPHVQLDHFTLWRPQHLYLPFGVALFAFAGLMAVPEMREVAKDTLTLRRAVRQGLLLTFILYAVFIAIIVGATGLATSPEALRGLGTVLGGPLELVGAALGLCVILSAFMTQGLALTHTFADDYKIRYLLSWAIAVGAPALLVLAGAQDFVRVIQLTGGIGFGVCGLLLLLAYERLRDNPANAKRTLAIPTIFVFLAALVFSLEIVVSIIG